MSISFELAKQLKDGGFPQLDAVELGSGYYKADIYYPTLSELIEACGKQEFSLIFDKTEWGAYKGGEHRGIGWGKTPEEAVARLWLKIHEYGS